MQNLKSKLPSLSSLLPFEATARLGSITKAADELGLTQAAISRQIKALEDNLGISLFERRNRAVYLTEEGRAFEETVSEALKSIATHSSSLRSQHPSNEVVLLVQLCEGFYWLMPNLSKFYQRHPNINVRVSATTKSVGQTTENFDLALQTATRESGPHTLVFTAPDEVFPVCSPQFLKGEKLPLHLEKISIQHLLHHQVDPQEWMDWDEWLKHVSPKIQTENKGSSYENYLLVIQAAIEGHGIALGWRKTTEHLLKTGSLIRPFKESIALSNGISIYQNIYNTKINPNNDRPEVAALLNWLKEELTDPTNNNVTRQPNHNTSIRIVDGNSA